MAIQARIVRIVSSSSKKAKLVLEPNPFRPAGGGQPGDSGILEGEGFSGVVRDCLIEEGVPVVWVDLKKGKPEEGQIVEAEPDMERQALLSRMHSGEHILSRILENTHEGLYVYKVNIGEEESVISLHYDGQIGWDELFAAEAAANEVIRQNLPVSIEVLPIEEAQKLNEIKANWDRIEDDSIRVVRMGDFDVIACCGSHVASTGEVGGILVTGFKGSAPEWEVKFTVHREREIEEESRILRRLVRKVGCRQDELEKVYEKLQEERQELQKILEKVKPWVTLPWERRTLGEIEFYSASVASLPLEIATPGAKSLIDGNPNALVLALLPSGSDNRCVFLLCHGSNVPLDLRAFLKKHPELEARGGGADAWVSGQSTCTSMNAWIEALKKELLPENVA